MLTTFTIEPATHRASAMVVSGVSTPLTYDARHLTYKGAQAYTFDRSDHLLGIAGFASYRYDAEGRRIVVETNGESRTAIYDHDGRLLVELEPGLATGCNPANDRVFCNSFEKPPANVSQTRYVYLGRHLIGKDGAPGLRYLHTDALRSLVAETDASKTVTQRYRYEPYGRPFGAVADGPGYAGHVMDASGLIYMQARYYDPQLGRFLSTDPVDADSATGSNFNRYAYGDSNPFRFIDPDGRESRDFDWISKQEDVTPPPQSPDDWLGPALGVALGAVAAPAVVAAGAELGSAALANPETATAIANGIMEAGAGEALGGASIAASGDEALTRVGRWMGEAEHDAMVASGRVQESTLSGVTSVSSPPNPEAWIRQTTAPRYVEFDVPSSAVRPVGSANAKIYGPNSIFGPHLGIAEMPSAKNLVQTACRVPLQCQ